MLICEDCGKEVHRKMWTFPFCDCPEGKKRTKPLPARDENGDIIK